MLHCIATFFCLIGFAQPRNEALETGIQKVISAPEFKHAHWGLLVVDPATSQTVFELNADHLFAPASTTKLYSVAAALEALGPDHRFETHIVRKGDVVDGTLVGRLILVGSGDPTLGGRTDENGKIAYVDNDHTYAAGSPRGQLTPQDPLAGLRRLAVQVAGSGIRHIRGDVLVDDRLYVSAQSTGSGPRRLSPIMLNDNLIDLTITPGDNPGDPAKVAHRPQSAALAVDAKVMTSDKTGEALIEISGAGNNRVVVRGSIPQGRDPLVRIHEIGDPASFTRSCLIEALESVGVRVDASPLSSNLAEELPPREAIAGLPKVATLTSPPLVEHVKLILKVSHNLHASTLPMLLSVKEGGRTLDHGLRTQGTVLRKMGLAVDEISFGGGAGGSFSDLTTPRVTVQLLNAVRSRPYFAAYVDALPILGIDGTLARAVDADSPARGKVRAKTGTYTVTNVMNHRTVLTSKALAGYMTTRSNRDLIFSMVVNNAHMSSSLESDRFGRVLGKLCEVFVTSL